MKSLEAFLEIDFWGNSLKSYLLALLVAVCSLVVAWIASAVIRAKVIQGSGETKTRLDDLVAGVGSRVIFLLVFLAGLHAGIQVLVLADWLDRLVWAVFLVAWTLLGSLATTRLLNGLVIYYVKDHARKTESRMDDQLVPVLRSVIQVGVWVVAALFALSNLGFEIGSILAGLGLGGLALAMASKDLLANIFGAFTIFFQGPFRVGDSVEYQGHSGKIEQVGMRATRLRTWDGHLVTVPNSLATTSVVENVSARPSERVVFKLGLEYDTPAEQCDRAAELVRQAVTEQQGTREDPSVHFVEFGESALVFQVVYYIVDLDRIMEIRHAVNRRIKQLLELADIRTAFPTVTVRSAARS
ncbi:MAG: mechanosensitive ion channel family protein [Deltaproteobacteria bacterium]|nr:mechanosensitive ion channel family protein [Deltaproteobacteria bacterium]